MSGWSARELPSARANKTLRITGAVRSGLHSPIAALSGTTGAIPAADSASMAHSVSGHLQVDVADYDRRIRQLVPAYEAMRRVQLETLGRALRHDGRVLDLGGGTGALAAAVAETFPGVQVEIWDTDPSMLAVARGRCAGFGDRIHYVERSFAEPLPPCDAVVACIALHHVKDLAVKARIYRHIHEALQPGGIFVNADTAVNTAGVLREQAFAGWAASMRPHGIDEAAARVHFATWAHEDFYPPLSTELRLLTEAGFTEPDCVWREAAAVVFAAVK